MIIFITYNQLHCKLYIFIHFASNKNCSKTCIMNRQPKLWISLLKRIYRFACKIMEWKQTNPQTYTSNSTQTTRWRSKSFMCKKQSKNVNKKKKIRIFQKYRRMNIIYLNGILPVNNFKMKVYMNRWNKYTFVIYVFISIQEKLHIIMHSKYAIERRLRFR